MTLSREEMQRAILRHVDEYPNELSTATLASLFLEQTQGEIEGEMIDEIRQRVNVADDNVLERAYSVIKD